MSQLCWTCGNATGGCSWTAINPETGRVMFRPVPGWNATPTSRRLCGKTIMESYEIHSCPKYAPDCLDRLSDEERILLYREHFMKNDFRRSLIGDYA